MKKTLCTFLSLLLLLPLAVFPQAVNTAAALGDGTVIYSEDFNRDDLSGNASVLSALGWEISSELNPNTARYSIENGKLVCDNLTASVGTSKDSYVTILDDAAMREVAEGNYTISYDLRYISAENAQRYAAIIYNYNGYQNYNSVHIRIGGTGNNQVRYYGSQWKSYDENSALDAPGYLASNGAHSVASLVFGKETSISSPYALTGETMTVTVKVDAKKGPTVYINGILVSEPTGKFTELFLSSREYGSAVALKTSLKVKAEIDNIIIYTGTGDVPADRTVRYDRPVSTDTSNLRVMSLNVLYSHSGDVAFDDGLTRAQHMVSLVSGEHPDIIGFQERAAALKTNMTDLLVNSCGYAAVDEYRTDTVSSGVIMQTPIFYNANKYELVANSSANGNLAHGNFIYKNSYQTTGKNIGASSTYTKSLAWGVLRDKQTGQLILAMNTHQAVYVSTYNNYSSEDAIRDRVCNAQDALAKLKSIYAAFGNIPTVYTGDFNMRQNEEAYRLLQTMFLDSVNCAPDSILYEYSMSNDDTTITDPNFLRAPNSPIDHIFFSGEGLTINHYNVLNDCPEMMIATDHLGVVSDFTIDTLSAPRCSHTTGIYDSLQRITLYGDGIFYFTTDGSDPRTSDTRKTYSGMITAMDDTELKYCAYAGGKFSKVMTVRLYFGTPLYITEAIKNTSGSDLYEGVEIINVSPITVDLYDFRLWEFTDTDPDTVKNIAASSVTANMRISERPGQYTVVPGEVVYLQTVFSELYTLKRTIAAGKSVYLVEMDKETATPRYRTDYVAAAIAYDKAGTISADRIIPIDRTARSFGYTQAGEKVIRKDAQTSNPEAVPGLAGGFNLGNAMYNRLYLTLANASNVDEAFCIADLDGTDNGTYLKGTALSAKEGGYQYLPVEGSALMKTASFTEKAYSIGSLNDAQKAAFMYLLRSNDYNYTALPGDANNDSTVDTRDLIMIRRYLSNLDFETGLSTVTLAAGADANCDTAVNTRDIALLRRYFASYDYDTGLSDIVLGKN